MDLSTLYLILILPNLAKLATITAILLTMVGSGVAFISYLDEDQKGLNFSKGLIKYIIPLIALGVFIPSNKQMMYIIGGYAVTNVEGIEKLPKNVVGAANKFLEQFNVEEQLEDK